MKLHSKLHLNVPNCVCAPGDSSKAAMTSISVWILLSGSSS